MFASTLLILFLLSASLIDGFKYKVDRFVEAAKGQPHRECRLLFHDSVKWYMNWIEDWFKEAAAAYSIKIFESAAEAGNDAKFDVVIFHAPTHRFTIGGETRSMYPGATLAMLSMEQPHYARVLKNLQYLSQHFDLMVTYSLAPVYPGTKLPNLPVTYFPSNIFSAEDLLKPAPRSFTEKDGFGTGVSVAVFASNCKAAGARERVKYLKELMDYVPVHSYGYCLNNRKEPEAKADDPLWPPHSQRRSGKVDVLSHYKFYLAFENSPVDDYVSEKVYEGYLAGALPVYRGTVAPHRFMPANDSFIDANNMSPRELADLLVKLSNSESEYQKYFEFKKREVSKQFETITQLSYMHPNAVKRLCDYAQHNKTTSSN